MGLTKYATWFVDAEPEFTAQKHPAKHEPDGVDHYSAVTSTVIPIASKALNRVSMLVAFLDNASD